MGTRVFSTLGDLERDMIAAARGFKPLAVVQVRDVAKDGNEAGKRNARVSSRRHAKKYPGTFSAERKTPTSYEWGPRAEGQGKLALILERGSRHNPPHHDIAKAADLHGAGDLGRRIQGRVFDELFWP